MSFEATDAIAAIDRLHEEDPAGLELGYAQAMTRWLERLQPAPDPLLAIAVRAQHLKRWECPRDEYPSGRDGYLQWRRGAAAHHAQVVTGVLTEAGFGEADVERVADLVLKRGIGTDSDADADAQTLEDCAALVFLETALAGFAAKHAEPKVERILRRTWAKMSPPAQRLAETFVTAPGE
jgi:hypothetical protein